jgi:predicted Zn-dependent protease
MAASLSAAALAAACATNPATGEREFSLMSEQQEIALGQETDQQVRREMGVYDDQQLNQYVTQIGQRLAKVSERPTLPWHFAVVDDGVVNAFALPGGYIYLSRGILPYLNSEAEMAGVLGHEIGHVTARHSAQQYSRATGASLGLALGSILFPEAAPFGQLAEAGIGLLFLKYGRDDELQADSLGVRYTARSGWDPAGVAGMLQTLDRIDEGSESDVPNWLSTHPAPADRVEQVQAAIQKARAEFGSKATETDREAYLQRIDGIIYGDNPEQGIVRGNEFLHPVMRFALEFPQGWQVQNSPTQVIAKQPNANHFVLLELVQKPQGRNIQEVAISSMQNAKFRALDGDRTTINGLEAFVGTYQGALQGLGEVGVRAAHIAYNKNVFMVAGIAPAQSFNNAQRTLDGSVRSFRPLSASQAEQIRPNRIDLYTARSGDTWASIAERAGRGVVKPSTLAIMNGRTPNEQPRNGDRLKIVVAG